MLEFNGHEISNEFNIEWNGEKSIIGQELQKVFALKVESKEKTNQFSKDETLIEEKSNSRINSRGHENKPLDSMVLFEDKAYENWWMSNQVSIIIFEIEHALWICGSHYLKILLK